jgi:hypothetical protein
MNTVRKLIEEVEMARTSYLDKIANVTEIQALWKPNPEVWNIIEITEHLFWAEQGGIVGMWKTLHAIRDGNKGRTYKFIQKDMPFERVIDMTWQPKEKVPAVAAPRLGRPISFWNSSFPLLLVFLQAFLPPLEFGSMGLLLVD